MTELQRAAEAVGAALAAEHGRDPVAYVLGQVGGNTGRALAAAEDRAADLAGSIAIELIDPDQRPYSSFEVLRRLQAEARKLPETEELSLRSAQAGPGGDALSIQLYGAETLHLKAAAAALTRDLAQYPEVSGLTDTMPWDKREVTLELTPRAQVLGFAIDDIGRVLRDRLNGIEALSVADGPRSATIRVDLPDSEQTADFLDRTLLRAPSGQYLPLGDLVRIDSRDGFASIRRENGLRTLTVTGDLSDDDPARAAEIMAQLETTILPGLEASHQVRWQLSGLAEQERDFLTDAAVGFTLCLLGIFFTLAWIFASWTRPLAIMAVIPFGLIGAVWGHYVWGVPLSMFSVVGLIGMTGIIINDSIVLITTIDDYARDRDLRPVARRAADHLDHGAGAGAAALRDLDTGAVPEAHGHHAGLWSGLRDGARARGGPGAAGERAGYRAGLAGGPPCPARPGRAVHVAGPGAGGRAGAVGGRDAGGPDRHGRHGRAGNGSNRWYRGGLRRFRGRCARAHAGDDAGADSGGRAAGAARVQLTPHPAGPRVTVR